MLSQIISNRKRLLFYFFTHTNIHMHINTMSKMGITRIEMTQRFVFGISDIECECLAQSKHVLDTLTLCRSCNISLILFDSFTFPFMRQSKALKCTQSIMSFVTHLEFLESAEFPFSLFKWKIKRFRKFVCHLEAKN